MTRPFIYISERERWRTAMLLLWKHGPLQGDRGGAGAAAASTRPIVQLICEYAAPPWPTSPLPKLTINLINTYTAINIKFYHEKKTHQAREEARQLALSTGNFTWSEDLHGYRMNGRYELKGEIGAGAFGVVLRAFDTQTGAHVAIKVIKAKKPYSKQARREIGLLQHMRAADPSGRSNVVELRGHFVYDNPGVGRHECLVFEMLHDSLYEMLGEGDYAGFGLHLVRKYARQLLGSLAFLAHPSVRIIHSDIKPENICMRMPKSSALRLIDFGSSCKEGENIYDYITSRYYRAPEVLMTCGYNVAIDVWSLACVLVELYLGGPLFCGENRSDQVGKIMAYKGMPPDKMIDRWAKDGGRATLFAPAPGCHLVNVLGDPDPKGASKPRPGVSLPPGARRWVALDPHGLGRSRLLDTLEAVRLRRQAERERERARGGHHGAAGPRLDSRADVEQFKDLIERMTEYDPCTRLHPNEALNHPFITNDYVGSLPYLERQRAQAARAAQATGGVGGGGGLGAAPQVSPRNQTDDQIMSANHQMILCSVLAEIGCPALQVHERRPMTWQTISGFLQQYSLLNGAALDEAHRRYLEFAEQPLRHRQQKALDSLVGFLRQKHAAAALSHGEGGGAGGRAAAAAAAAAAATEMASAVSGHTRAAAAMGGGRRPRPRPNDAELADTPIP